MTLGDSAAHCCLLSALGGRGADTTAVTKFLPHFHVQGVMMDWAKPDWQGSQNTFYLTKRPVSFIF